MLHVYFGTDRERARSAVAGFLAKHDGEVLRVTDAHSLYDLRAALQGPGMFGTQRIVVFDGLFSGESEEMREELRAALEMLATSSESFVLFEGALDAATKKELGKFAKTLEQYDLPKKAEEKTIFALANALQRADKKALWVGLMREFAKGSAPEAVHGLLFWGAKQLVLRSARNSEDYKRGVRLVAMLAELPHESRRKGEDLSYALERFALSRL